jgi:hypothetical protein
MTARAARVLMAVAGLAGCPALVDAQWVAFADLTSTRLSFPGSTTDDAEKDFQVADLNNDGLPDLVDVRKEAWGDGPRTHVLLMNVNGVLTDQTATYAPGFLANPSLARTSVVGDFDNDGWKDVVVVNTNDGILSTNYQAQYYKNLGSAAGAWLGLQLEAGRLPTYNPVGRFASAAAGDVDGDADLDLFIGSYFSQGLGDRLCINDGTGHFTDQTAARFPTGNNASSYSTEVQMADVELDGDLDIVECDNGDMKAHLNDGSGVFTTLVSPNLTTYTCAVGDLNNDGKLDLYQGRDGQDAYTINTSPAGGPISFTTTTLMNAPKTNNFAGNAYLVDIDGDGDNDLAMADTDVDVPGCARRAVLYRNGTIGPAQAQVLMDPWYDPVTLVNTFVNIHTQGTHDLAIFDLDGDGRKDIVDGRCLGYQVFIQEVSLTVTEPSPGGLSMIVNGAAANATFYTLIATVQLNPPGTGPFFGLDPSALNNFLQLSPTGQPFVATANGLGQYQFSLPPGTLPSPLPTQWRTVELFGTIGYAVSNVVTITF